MVLLLALTMANKVGHLCALSMHPLCICFSDLSQIFPSGLRSSPYLFRSRVIHLWAFSPTLHSDREEKHIYTLCSVCMLYCYVEYTAAFRKSDLLFFWLSGWTLGAPLSVQWVNHWIWYGELHSPSGLEATHHYGLASSITLSRGVSVEDICQSPSPSSILTMCSHISRAWLLVLCPIQFVVHCLSKLCLEQTEVCFGMFSLLLAFCILVPGPQAGGAWLLVCRCSLVVVGFGLVSVWAQLWVHLILNNLCLWWLPVTINPLEGGACSTVTWM